MSHIPNSAMPHAGQIDETESQAATGASEVPALTTATVFWDTSGLSVSLGLAKALGGDLRVGNTTSRGTTMDLWLRSSLRPFSALPTDARAQQVAAAEPVAPEGPEL